ncbi:hypothetical protein [Asticcacaulis sp. AND118]|uniref:hypothetical protein n=1 Tax=Asticcacaulis sp. AND118 TaxID=2840468 RepID=UPI001CFFAF34|nr:hypothetical protein [Asticcacaulis sp. AND118]UDF02689.1 hypothetical protein LH365_09605 [Asticcacaulis sp. AND118]
MTHADPHTPAYSRLMRLADQVLSALETAPRPTNAMEIARAARAILAAERMLRAIYTPLVKAKHPPLRSGGGGLARNDKTEGAKSVRSAPSASTSSAPPPLRPDGLTGEERILSSSPAPAAAANSTETTDANWQKGWADKQAQMREQRAARTGKWPDGTAYKKPS